MRHFFKFVTATILVSVGLLGCDAHIAGGVNGPVATKASGKTFGASLTGYNHTDKSIGAFYVNGGWGGNIFGYS